VLLRGFLESPPTSASQILALVGVDGTDFQSKVEEVMQADRQVSYDARGPSMLTGRHGLVTIFGASQGQLRLDCGIVTSNPHNESGHYGGIQTGRSIGLTSG
jgi:hypothetical protein